MKSIQVETITTHDGRKMDVIRDVATVQRVIEIAKKAMNSIRDFQCGHKPWYESGKCSACEALQEWDALAPVVGTGKAVTDHP